MQHTLGTDDKTPSLFGAAIDGLDDVDELLFVLKDPVELVVVSRAEITHDVLISEEEHDGTRIVEFCVRCQHLSSALERGFNEPYIWLKSGTWSMSQTYTTAKLLILSAIL